MNNRNEIDDSIYDDKELKLHEPYLLPIMKEIALRTTFFKFHDVFIEFLRGYVEWDAIIKESTKELLHTFFADFNSSSIRILGREFPESDESISELLSEYDERRSKIESLVEESKAVFYRYFEINSVSDHIRSVFFDAVLLDDSIR